MAEALGLAVGFIGLAGLFSTCVDCFKFVQIYGAQSSDYEILQTMLDNQQFHFMAWGKACGFMDSNRAKSRFDDPLSGPRNRRIEETMERIHVLLTDCESLKKKYGLKVQRSPMGSKAIERPALSAFSKAFQSSKDFCHTNLQRKTQITGTLRWAVEDRDKFDRLIQNLKDLLSDLTSFTEDIGVPDSEHLIVEYELEMMDDEPSLQAITAASACDDDDDVLSSVASRRLSRVKAQSVANQSVGLDDGASMASFAGYTPSISSLVEEEVDGVVQEIGVMRVPISQWRKVKTRAGIMPWLKTIVLATGSSPGISDYGDDFQALLGADTLSSNPNPTTIDRPVRVAINSQVLINALRKVTAYRFSPKHNVLIHPFKPLVVYESDLRRYIADMQRKLLVLEEASREEPADSDDIKEPGLKMEGKAHKSPALGIEKARRIVEELECLLELMNNDMSEVFQTCKRIRDRRLEKISFENLWLMFQPGTIAISPDPAYDQNDRAYQILHATGGRPILDVDNNSGSEGLGNLEDLDRNSHDGYAIMSSRECTDFVVDCFYLDFDGFSYGPRPQMFVIPEFTGERDVVSLPLYPIDHSSTEMKKLNLKARGFRVVDFTRRQRFRHTGLALKEWDSNHRDVCLLEELGLADEDNSRLLALLERQVRKAPKYRAQYVNVVQDKGRGVLIQLQGAAGTGKTLVAEAIAARLRKPILPFRIADLGSTPREIKQTLIQFMALAERWGCVLLMRQAEAISAQRTGSDWEGNDMISVFIDALEYFTGILVFTVNTSHADAIVRLLPRVHLVLLFRELNPETGIKIWKVLLKRLRAERRIEFDSKEILWFAEHEYVQFRSSYDSDRISNDLAMAVALAQKDAEYEGEYKVVLKKSHLEAMARLN
ncbi:MAG: hypothetical protein Q9165_001940 [Trypethelium subeluteriae]